RDPEPERRGHAGAERDLPAAAVVAEGLPAGLRRLPPRVELLGRAVAAVGPALVEEALGVGAVDLEPAGLPEIPAVAAVVLRAFVVPIEAEPGHRVEDLVDGLVRRAIAVGVLDPEEERTAVVAGEEPVEEGRPGATDVEVPRGARGEANADGLS